MDGSTVSVQAPGLSFGRSAGIRHLVAMAKLFAVAEDPILILGERGTGKTSLARQVHTWSGRPGLFVSYQLSSSHDELHQSELFGHAKGAFTGAHADHQGLVEASNNGTLFLDEFGEASPRLQLSMLSTIDRRGVRRLGEGRDRPVTGRVIVATNADLYGLANEGLFRRDLLDRLGYFTLLVPPLRSRPDEVLPLFQRFVSAALPSYQASIGVSPQVEEVLQGHFWPGNVRQLENVARYAARVMSPSEPIGVCDLPRAFLDELGPDTSNRGRTNDSLIREALRVTGGNVSQAARKLGMSRRTIQRRLRAE